jgi:hypothetical protein
MHRHSNASLTQNHRLRLINQYFLHYCPLAELLVEAGIFLRCAYKRQPCNRSGGAAALIDRRSVRRPIDERFIRSTLSSAPLVPDTRRPDPHSGQKAGPPRQGRALHTGKRQEGCTPCVGYDRLHVAIHYAT